ncbi:prostatic acid phosphatase-like [Ostrinia nubilalis]|uniref:prostatic acid phosphatase-like n=1 Tax=Ostrinia nubilalis TaxID=29057 RepID=UPI0030825992
MIKLCCAVLLLAGATARKADKTDKIIEGTELLLTFLVHRHGDRTPIAETLVFSNNPDKLAELSAPYGYGQLTTVGKRRSYELGKFIRKRYDGFIARQFNRSEIFIRSTDSTRAKMTILSALAAIYPPVKKVFRGLDWTPVPYSNVPAKYDFNMPFANCPNFMNDYRQLLSTTSPAILNYSYAVSLLSNITGLDMFQNSGYIYAVYDVYTSQVSLGLPLEPKIQAVWPDVEAAAGIAIGLVNGNETLLPYQAGVLLSKFYDAVSEVTTGDTSRMRIYSAHDFNVYSFQAVTKIVNKQGVPKYNSAYALELRRNVHTGELVVVPVYLPSPGQDPIYLEIEGCGSVCNYNDFVAITSEYALDEDTWRTKCGFTSDLVIDSSSFA